MNSARIIFLITIIFVFGFLTDAATQPRISASNQNFIQVSSSQTQTFTNAFQVQISLVGVSQNYPNWSLAASLNQEITNGEGKTLPHNKIKLSLSDANGTTFSQIGSGTTPVQLNGPGIRSLLISSSKVPLQNSSSEFYSQYVFTVDVTLQGGTYLDALKSWQNYAMNIAFLLLDNKGVELARHSAVDGIQIRPDGTYAPPATYGIQIQNNARSGLLELKTMNDYVNGASVSYDNGLIATAATPYSIMVRSSSANFNAGTKTLPISVVNLQLTSTNNSGFYTTPLSESSQTVGIGGTNTASAQAYKYNIRYFTKANDSRLINGAPDNYSAILIYEIIPQ